MKLRDIIHSFNNNKKSFGEYVFKLEQMANENKYLKWKCEDLSKWHSIDNVQYMI